MRLYSPEWEAIRDFEYVPRCKDVQFDLVGSEIPADHGYSLYAALADRLPWLAGTAGAGIHPIHGAPTGRNDNLVINRRVKLVLRVPVERLDDVHRLVGTHIDSGAGELAIGAAKDRQLLPFAHLYSPLVVFDSDDEVEFLAAARAELEKMAVQCGMIPGKRRKMRLPGGEVWGYSLMLHDVGQEQSLRVQEQGLGHHRAYGCGLFVPHKSIKEVAAG
ncbi:MAG: type I-MYXAN CRISPR-associated protein Cas6/Cmx6 [Gallionellaceae bacterium]|nr:type I-MYXAN CRISPR-associated protein Cas6/Cmx6 [Gallionellaceae bacterium]